jgi:hypothetical protein
MEERCVMKICLHFVYFAAVTLLPFAFAYGQADNPRARIVTLTVEPEQVLELHLQPGYVSSVRVLEDVSSVVLGDPGNFKAEHSEAEPELVFFKATNVKPARTNALITTKAGREISLSLASAGKQGHGDPIDYVLNCERPRSFLISPDHPSFVIAETKTSVHKDSTVAQPIENASHARQEVLNARLQNPHWEGKSLRVAAGQPTEKDQAMTVPFAVLNASERTVEILPPQIELMSLSRNRNRNGIKAEPIPIADYAITARTLAPKARADGFVVFERPSFKESRERLMLAIAQAAGVDRPVLVPVDFVAPIPGGTK